MQFQLHKTLAWKNCEWNSWLTFCSEFKSNQSDQIAYLYTLKGLNSNDINWGSYFVAHQRNIIFCQVIFTKAYSRLSLYNEACLNFKYTLRECVCCVLCDDYADITSHFNLYLLISENQSVCPKTKVLHLFRIWSSQSCRLRPRIQLLWQPTRQRAMVHAASPNWSPPLAQVT